MFPRLSIIVPAFNEQALLGATLDCLRAAIAECVGRGGDEPEVIVVDNASTDGTAAVALRHDAHVVTEPVHNIARVRNAGARASHGDALVFFDADTRVPPHALARIGEELDGPSCAGGALDMLYRPRRPVMRWYLGAWRLVGNAAGMAMGSGQFCRRAIFDDLGGYDETIFMGEDVDFFWRLRRHARRRGLRVPVLHDVVVSPSSRRFDQWPLWRVLVWTNPFFALALRRRRSAWSRWYTRPVR